MDKSFKKGIKNETEAKKERKEKETQFKQKGKEEKGQEGDPCLIRLRSLTCRPSLERSLLFFTNPWIVFGDPKHKSDLFVAYLIEEWGILEEDEEADDDDDEE